MEILARAVGRRKEAVAQVQLVRGNGQFLINDKPAQAYLQNNSCSLICIKSPLQAALSLFPTNPNGEEKVTLLNKGDQSETGNLSQKKSEDVSDSFGVQGSLDNHKNSFGAQLLDTDPLNSSKEALGQGSSLSEKPLSPPLKEAVTITGDSSSLPRQGVFNWGEKEREIDIIVKVKGGGLIGQAEAIKLGVARAFCIMENVYGGALLRKILKTKGYLTQDSRVKERRKYGLKKARKASQYHKR